MKAPNMKFIRLLSITHNKGRVCDAESYCIMMSVLLFSDRRKYLWKIESTENIITEEEGE